MRAAKINMDTNLFVIRAAKVQLEMWIPSNASNDFIDGPKPKHIYSVSIYQACVETIILLGKNLKC